MIGNVYAIFANEEEAELAARNLNGRYYSGRTITTEFSPVTDFKEARCRQYDEGACDRGGYCNFMHLKHISRSFKKSLLHQMYYENPELLAKRIKRLKLKKRPTRRPESPEKKAIRQSSEERRAMIAQWNAEEDK